MKLTQRSNLKERRDEFIGHVEEDLAVLGVNEEEALDGNSWKAFIKHLDNGIHGTKE